MLLRWGKGDNLSVIFAPSTVHCARFYTMSPCSVEDIVITINISFH